MENIDYSTYMLHSNKQNFFIVVADPEREPRVCKIFFSNVPNDIAFAAHEVFSLLPNDEIAVRLEF